ncbi:hypothetical protein EII14_04235 [Alloprevotella sp. OH1205_COT-284]|uniref:hypothetical protein n=1 Tax=Alloprevotella sp. OH1205_COT-284 TaxID=2491043 RepID=UPI000F5E8AD6|nr:hypothetical protein [Alloprevotella sp. OH1205_COT-284]RRD80047.1 hypothetical protein EII14_04235 [Alloprevotella sp. OH1205_COT-284]
MKKSFLIGLAAACLTMSSPSPALADDQYPATTPEKAMQPAQIAEGYYYLCNGRTENNAVYVGFPEIPEDYIGSCDNEHPYRGCWTFMKEPVLSTNVPNIQYVFHITKTQGNFYHIRHLATDRFLRIDARNFYNIPTSKNPTYLGVFMFLPVDGKPDTYVIQSPAMHPSDTGQPFPHRCLHASGDCNAVVMWHASDIGSHWKLVPLDEKKVQKQQHISEQKGTVENNGKNDL